MGDVLDPLVPDRSVKSRVDEDLRGAHLLARKLDHRLNGNRCSLPTSSILLPMLRQWTYVLETVTVHPRVEVDGVFPGDDVREGGTLLSLGLGLSGSSH